ncbi:MAG: MATE family efflux transporter [Clostridiales Family XIII bacterium]|jgi:putative MATE family efflux protein|nr:MATE family efflux transporter [Clostridiales Family XIII bacterium]
MQEEGNLRTENKMGVLPINRLLFTMSFPAMISMIVSALYNVIESIFVASISEDAMAAVTLVFPVQMLMMSVAVGSGVGLASLISRRLGAKRQEEAESAAAHGFILALVHWAVFACFGLFAAKPFFALYTDDPYIYESAVNFCRIVTIGSLFVNISVTCERVLQAMGNMIFPMTFNMTAAILNCILAPTLILGWFGAPKLGVIGAGVAVVTCQFVGMSIALVLLFLYKKHPMKPRFAGFRIRGAMVKDIYSVGIPSMVMMSIGSFMISGLNAILIGHGNAAVAVLGVYYRLQSFIFMPVFGLNQGSMPIMGYNFGARKKDRLMMTFRRALVVAVGIMTIGTVLFHFCAHGMLALFSATPEMFEIGMPALRIISLCFVPAAVSIVGSAMFQALGHGGLSLTVSLLRQLVLILPLTWLLLRTLGIDAAWASFPLAEGFALLLSVFFIRRLYNKEIRTL